MRGSLDSLVIMGMWDGWGRTIAARKLHARQSSKSLGLQRDNLGTKADSSSPRRAMYPIWRQLRRKRHDEQ